MRTTFRRPGVGHAARARLWPAVARWAGLASLCALSLSASWAQTAAPGQAPAPEPASVGSPAQATSAPAAISPEDLRKKLAAPVPIQAFFGREDIESASLSPSGRWIAVKGNPGQGRNALVIFDAQTAKPQHLALRFSDLDIDDVYWVNDDQLVVTTRDDQRGGGDQRFWPGLFKVDRDGKGFRPLVKVDGSRISEMRTAQLAVLDVNHTLLHVPAAVDGGAGQTVVVGEWLESSPGRAPSLNAKRLDVNSGRTSNLSSGVPPNVRFWMFDARGEPRLVSTRDGSRGAYHWRAPGSERWEQLAEFDVYAAPWVAEYVDTQGQLFVSRSSGPDGERQLYRFDFKTSAPQSEPLASTPGFDFRGRLVTESAGGTPLGLRLVTDAENTYWFDARLKALQAQADARRPEHINRISCRPCQGENLTALVFSFNDRDPGQYWIYNGRDNSWKLLGAERGGIWDAQMAHTDFARVRMRDGLQIPVWITRKPETPVTRKPAVLLVHGGPWLRGRVWQWSAEAQFLASRGYVVIEPEFRGSRGYGQRLHRAGWRQWGAAMQDDLADAVAWAVSKGWVDADRVCIAGGSYGGYATLMGLIRHPERYRCGAAWVAVTDPRLMFQWRFGTDVSDDVRQVDLPRLIGDPQKDQAMLEAVTPVLHASRIKAPVLLAMGMQDRRVPLEHGDKMREALKAAGNPPLWLAYPDEGHGWFKVETRLDFYSKLEAFLAQHLQVRR